MSTTAEQIETALKVGVPLLAVQTLDQPTTLDGLIDLVTNMKTSDGKPANFAIIKWDSVRGAQGQDRAGEAALKKLYPNVEAADIRQYSVNLPEFLTLAGEKSTGFLVIFAMNAQTLLTEPTNIQAIMNLREPFKNRNSMLAMIGPDFNFPPELATDVLVIDEPLPTREKIAQVVKELAEDRKLEINDDQLNQAADALVGLSEFSAEQTTAQAFAQPEIDIATLQRRKIQMISATKGLEVWKGGERFTNIGGNDNIKWYLNRVLKGPGKPNVVVVIEEGDKLFSNNTDLDTSGVSQDQLQQMLTWMEDKQYIGMIFFGVPGAAKSLVCKATGNESGVLSVRFDLGGMKGSFVGESERAIRNGQKVVDAVGQGSALLLMTCNKYVNIPSELRRRFRLGVFYFDLPTTQEREQIWDIMFTQYPTINQDRTGVNDDGWTGAEIKQCCDIAWRLGVTLTEAATFVVPVSKSDASNLTLLREQAHGKLISASYKGTYQKDLKEEEIDEPNRRRYL